MSPNAVAVAVPTCAKLLQAAPVQRSTRYWLIVPPVSVAAVQVRLICVLLAAVAVKFEGAVITGAPESVVPLATFEYVLVFPAESTALIR